MSASATLAAQLSQQVRIWLGTSEFGVIIASVFYGVNILQLYNYASTRERRDPLWIRALIAWVWCLDTAHTALIWAWLFDKTVIDAADPAKLLKLFDMSNALVLSVVFSGFIGASVQSFYAYRIHRLAGHPLFSIPAWVGSAVRAGLSVTLAVFGKKAGTLVIFALKYNWAIHGVLGASVAVDIYLTLVTCVLLTRQRDGLQQTATMISKMTVWTVENGLLTSLTALTMLGLSLAKQFSSVPALLHVYAKLFSFSLLVTLNSREKLRQALYTTSPGSAYPSRNGAVSSRPHGVSQHKEPPFELVDTSFRSPKSRDVELGGVIHVDTEISTYYDSDMKVLETHSSPSSASSTRSPHILRKPVSYHSGGKPPKPGMI